MNEQQALSLMMSPARKQGKRPDQVVIQILVTSSCNLSCFSCTQNSQFAQPKWFMTPEQFEEAVLSLKGFPGTIGTFGGSPCLSPYFVDYCTILRKHVPMKQCGLWANDLFKPENGEAARITYNPAVSNLNCHLSQEAYDRFKKWWPESMPFGLNKDSRHSPVLVSMKDLNLSEEERWDLISKCDINQYWSALIGVFRGKLRAWFCEVAASQAILHQYEEGYPDTGLDPSNSDTWHKFRQGEQWYGYQAWWQLPMRFFTGQIRQHCHSCGVPLKGYGQLAQSNNLDDAEQVSQEHINVCKPKKKDRRIELIVVREQLGQPLERTTRYLQNADK